MRDAKGLSPTRQDVVVVGEETDEKRANTPISVQVPSQRHRRTEGSRRRIVSVILVVSQLEVAVTCLAYMTEQCAVHQDDELFSAIIEFRFGSGR